VLDRSGPSELYLVQGKRERNRCKRDQHQHPVDVHVSRERRLRLHRLSNPDEGLLLRLGERASVGGEVARDLLQRVLILDARRDRMLRQPLAGSTFGARKLGQKPPIC
jgi:hypothetical protein